MTIAKAKPAADSEEVTRLRRRQAVTESIVRHGMAMMPGGGERALAYDALLERADLPPPFVAGAKVFHTETLVVGEVVSLNEVTDVARVKWIDGRETAVHANLLDAWTGEGDRN
jgi:hypothetical protein